MKKVVLMLFVFAIVMSSCSNNGKKAETKDAEKVTVVKNEKTNDYNKIKSGSVIKWRASHLGGTNKRFGNVFLKNASVLVNQGKVSNATFLIDMNTITVESFPEGSDQKRDLTRHLKSSDFFDVQKYPVSKFELTKIKGIEGKFNSEVTGNLTIKDVTKSITFKANVKVDDNKVSVKSEDFSVDRTDWNLKYHVKGSPGIPVNYLISNDIGFTIDITVTK